MKCLDLSSLEQVSLDRRCSPSRLHPKPLETAYSRQGSTSKRGFHDDYERELCRCSGPTEPLRLEMFMHTRDPPPIKILKYSNREVFPALILSGNLENMIDAYLPLSFLVIFEIIGNVRQIFFKIILRNSFLFFFCGMNVLWKQCNLEIFFRIITNFPFI